MFAIVGRPDGGHRRALQHVATLFDKERPTRPHLGANTRGATYLVDHKARKQAALVQTMQDAPQRPEYSKRNRTGHGSICRVQVVSKHWFGFFSVAC
jgi:hypothetical protein